MCSLLNIPYSTLHKVQFFNTPLYQLSQNFSNTSVSKFFIIFYQSDIIQKAMHLFYNNMSNTSQEHIRTLKYKVTLIVHKLKINKSQAFQTRILWKRHNSKIESKIVNHAHGFSVFNQALELQFSLQYDTISQIFLEKNTEIVVVVPIGDNTKSGGYGKLDLAEALNSKQTKFDKTIALIKSPDPEAYVQVSLKFEKIADQTQEQPSMLNASSRDLNMSKIEFSQDHINEDLKEIQNTINKFDILAVQLKSKRSENIVPELKKRIQILEGENKELKKQLKNAEQKLAKNESNSKTQKKDFERQINNLEKQLDKKAKQLSQKTKEIAQLNQSIKKSKSDQDSTESDKSNFRKYQDLYQAALQKLQEKQFERIQLENKLKQYMDEKRYKVDVHLGGKRNFQISSTFQQQEQTVIQKIEREKVQLQNALALASHKLAQIFNVAYEIGGAKLLDRLQSSIGLIQ